MENQLPKNWVVTELGNISLIQSGGTPSRANKSYWNGTIPWLKISDFKKLYINEAEEFISEDGLKNSSARLFPKETILFTIFASIGKIAILNFEATTNQAIAGITPTKKINHKYLVYSLKQLSESVQNEGKGVAQKNINLQILKETNIPLPPLPEQERIVAKLDTLFAQHERMKQALARIPQLLKDFRQQILTQAVTGKLTEEWRKGKDLEEWKDIFLEKLCNKITDGEHFRPEVQEEGVYFLSAKDIRDDKIDLNSPLFISEENAKKALARCNPELNDILVVSRGATVGRMCIVNIKDVFCLLGSVILIKPKNDIVSKYLYFLMKSPIIQKKLFNISGATAQQAIYLRDIKKIIIPVSPLAEQEEIVCRVESLFVKADAIEARYQTLKEKIDALPQTILHKAFKGELVPHLPTDGDAKDLLAEILKLKKENAKK